MLSYSVVAVVFISSSSNTFSEGTEKKKDIRGATALFVHYCHNFKIIYQLFVIYLPDTYMYSLIVLLTKYLCDNYLICVVSFE